MLDRDKLIADIADAACDSIDMKDLLQFFYDSQVEWAENLSNQELSKYASEYLYNFQEDDYQIDSTTKEPQ